MCNLCVIGFFGKVVWINLCYGEIDGICIVKWFKDFDWVLELVVIIVLVSIVLQVVVMVVVCGVVVVIIFIVNFGQGFGLFVVQVEVVVCVKGLCIFGLYCLGVIVLYVCFNVSIVVYFLQVGDLVLIFEFSVIVVVLVEWGVVCLVGFLVVVLFGDILDVDFGDLFDYFVIDYCICVILFYVEYICDVCKFMLVVCVVVCVKLVVVVKFGCYICIDFDVDIYVQVLVSIDVVYGVVFSCVGLFWVSVLDELFIVVEIFGWFGIFFGCWLVIFSNGGGVGWLVVDQLLVLCGSLVELFLVIVVQFDVVLFEGWLCGNLVDIVVDVDGECYVVVIEVLMFDIGNDVLLVVNVFIVFIFLADVVQVFICILGLCFCYYCDKFVFVVWLGNDDCVIVMFNVVWVFIYFIEVDVV